MNNSFGNSYIALDEYRSEWGDGVRVGETVEIVGGFLRIRKILQNLHNDNITLRGWQLKRVSALDGLVDNKMNELFIAAEDVDPDDTDESLDRIASVDVPFSDVLNEFMQPSKRELVITNQPFGTVNDGLPAEDASDPHMRHLFKTEGKLVCRWIFIVCKGPAPPVDKLWWPRNADLRRIRAHEADKGYSNPSWKLVQGWRGRLPGDDDSITFADFFTGCGGVTVGAVKAGFALRYGLDCDSATCETYAANNGLEIMSILQMSAFRRRRQAEVLSRPQGYVWEEFIHDWIQFAKTKSGIFIVDVIHLSPPCQYFSKMNVHAGLKPIGSTGAINDDRNQAALYSIPDILDITRPRYVTLEQTDGIFKERDYRDFRNLINFFTSRNFSVSWRRDVASNHGTASHRKRLILRAACPGGLLPPHPRATFGPGIRPYRTINDCIDHLDPEIHAHHEADWEDLQEVDPDSGDGVLRNIIMASAGTRDRHPSGRPFTLRELACLMTFPEDFEFPEGLTKKEIVRQIGNAVPPCVAYALMRSVKRTLLSENGEMRREMAETVNGIDSAIDLSSIEDNSYFAGISPDQPIEIDDDGDSDTASDTTMGRD